jgi:hypothetical protein
LCHQLATCIRVGSEERLNTALAPQCSIIKLELSRDHLKNDPRGTADNNTVELGPAIDQQQGREEGGVPVTATLAPQRTITELGLAFDPQQGREEGYP